MEQPNDTRLTSYYHHHQHPPTTTIPTNGILVNNNNNNNETGSGGALSLSTSSPLVYSNSVQPTSVVNPLPPETVVKRKRGRPRKYGTPEQALAAKKITSSTASAAHVSNKNKDFLVSGSGSSSKKSQQLSALGNAGQGFTPHIISVKAGEDVAQKMMFFMQQSKRELCILSASGSISNASLRQPATSGGGVTYEGRFEILSLSGSFIRTELGGRSGGLSVCLSNTDGQIIGGGVAGPLVAAGPVQVIVGTFLIDTKKDVGAGAKGDPSGNQFPSPIGGVSVLNAGFRPTLESSERFQMQSDDHHQNYGGSQFMIQSRGIHTTPSQPSNDWRLNQDNRSSGSYDFTGRTGHVPNQSPENGDYEQLPD